MTNQPDVSQQVRGALGLITEEDTAKVLLLNSVSTLATWRSQKTGPQYVKLGKRVFYTVNHLGAWINERSAAQAAAHNEAIQVAA